MIYLYYDGTFWRQWCVKKIQKRYYILIFIFALSAGVFLKSVEEKPFRIIKSSTAYAPEEDVVLAASYQDIKPKININHAGIYELDSLWGIGEKLAERIIEYRTKNGKFEVIQDIMKVNGIGEKTFNEIKDDICVE